MLVANHDDHDALLDEQAPSFVYLFTPGLSYLYCVAFCTHIPSVPIGRCSWNRSRATLFLKI